MPSDRKSTRRAAVRSPVTEARRRVFLQTLATTGSFATAARTASPGRAHPLGPASSFRSLMQRDAKFADQVREAEEQAVGVLELAAHKRAVEGVDRPIYQQGQLVGHEKVFSDGLLLRLLEARAPLQYGPKSRLELSGQVNTIGLQITPADLLALTDDQQEQLEQILAVIVEARGERQEPPLLEGPDQ